MGGAGELAGWAVGAEGGGGGEDGEAERAWKAVAQAGLAGREAPKPRWSRKASMERQCLPQTPQRGSWREWCDVRMCSTRCSIRLN